MTEPAVRLILHLMSKTVLCADDDPDDKELICEAINSIDPSIEVVHALNGVEALKKLQELKQNHTAPCLLIVDINMPLIGGKELVKKIKGDSLYDNTPIAVFTTSRNPSDVQYFATFNVDVYVKPTSVEEIKITVESMLALCVPE